MVRVFEKQKYYTVHTPAGSVKKPRYKECRCGAFTKTSAKKLSYWDTHCFNCGVEF